MAIDLTTLSEADLIALNQRIVERLQLIRSARRVTELARFSVGKVVEFTGADGRAIQGAIARLDRQTATVVSPSGSWPVLVSLLRIPDDRTQPASSARIVPLPATRRPD